MLRRYHILISEEAEISHINILRGSEDIVDFFNYLRSRVGGGVGEYVFVGIDGSTHVILIY